MESTTPNQFAIIYSSQFDSFVHGCIISPTATKGTHNNIIVKDSFIISTLHFPITSICQGTDFHTIAIGYQSGDVLIGYLDCTISNSSSPYPYGNTYPISNHYSLKKEFVFAFIMMTNLNRLSVHRDILSSLSLSILKWTAFTG